MEMEFDVWLNLFMTKGLTKKRKLKIETLAGIKELDLTIENGEVSYVTVNMGSPIMKAKFP